MTNKRLLEGIKIIDMSRILAGPWATQLLADYGADVIKIEKPSKGDDTRHWGPPWLDRDNEESDAAYFFAANRNKRSLTCDFSNREGANIIKQLVATCDVVIENFKPGTLEKYGLGQAQLNAINNKLIYCNITAFSEDSSRANEPGYDAMIQAAAGLMSLTGEKDGAPQKVGVAITDIMAGMYAVSAILAALFRREQDNTGQRINIPLFDSQVAWLVNQNMNYLIGDKIPQREGSAHPNIAPYQSFATKDSHIMLAVGNDNQFACLMKCLEVHELNILNKFRKNSQRVDNKQDLIIFLSELLIKHTTQYWLQLFNKNNIPCGPINNLEQVFNDEYTIERDMVRHINRHDYQSIPSVANPVKFSNYNITYDKAPPSLGEHTNKILTENLSYTAEQIKELRDKEII